MRNKILAPSKTLILRAARSGASRRMSDAKKRPMSAYLYILRCADGSYYVGTTRDSLEKRIAEHEAGAFDGYTALRRPVMLVFSQYFDRTRYPLNGRSKAGDAKRKKR